MTTYKTVSIDPELLGEQFKRLRVDAGQSLRGASAVTGLHHVTVSQIERGRLPSLEVFLSLALAYDIDVQKFLDECCTISAPGPIGPRMKRRKDYRDRRKYR